MKKDTTKEKALFNVPSDLKPGHRMKIGEEIWKVIRLRPNGKMTVRRETDKKKFTIKVNIIDPNQPLPFKPEDLGTNEAR